MKPLTLEYLKNYIKNIQLQNTEKQDIIEEPVEPLTLLKQDQIGTVEQFPKNILNFFGDISKIVRVGSNNNSTSFYACILRAYNSEFIKLQNSKKEKIVNEFKSNLLYNLNHLKLFDYFNYKILKWKKKDIIDDIHNNSISIYVVRYIMDYLNINIFVLDINNDEIYAYYPENKFDIHKPSIVLSQFCNCYELILHTSDVWSWKNQQFRCMLENSQIKTLDFDLNPKRSGKVFEIDFNCLNNINTYLDTSIYFLN